MSKNSDVKSLYALQFKPIYQSRMWGGDFMSELLHREVPQELKPVGEAWELVDRADNNSVVANGSLAGATLQELMAQYGAEILGPKGQLNAGETTRFPLLVKVIDAGDRLSLQVHPDEATCAKIGGGAEPKTEVWYILGTAPGAQIMAGLAPEATKEQILATFKTSAVEKYLQIYDAQIGDAFFITSGTLHAIGAGNLILEIQQNSDTTYRVSDWGRVDKNGKSRQLHEEKGLMSINFDKRTPALIRDNTPETGGNRTARVIDNCPFFDVEALHLATKMVLDTTPEQSFHLLSAATAPFKIDKAGAMSAAIVVNKGDSVLVPYCCGQYEIEPVGKEKTVVVKTTL